MKQNISIEEITSRLESRGYKVKKSGGVWRSQCPAHDGEDLNLAFAEGKNDGQIVFTCHSHNCTYEEIMASLGFEKEENPKPPKKSSYGGKTIHPTFEQAVSAAAFGAKIQKPPDAIYRYNDLDGGENFSVIRWDTENGKQTRPISKVDGGYICGTKNDGMYPVYRLPQVAEHLKSSVKTARIYVCEGEKATDAAVSLGLPATTSAFGSKSAAKTNWAVLNRITSECNVKLELVILPDNDEPGRHYAEALGEVFTKFKSNPIVKVVQLADFGNITGLSDFPDGGDVYDLCELLDSKTEGEIRYMIEKMVAETAPEAEIVDDEANAVYPWRSFPVEALPDTIAQHVLANAAASGCDPANVALADLVVLASAIGNSRRLQIKRGWIFPAILWGMIVARKGSIKTWSMVPAVRPLHLMQEEYHRQYDREKTEYDNKRAEFMLLSPKQRRDVTPPEIKAPIRKRILSRDATEARIVKNMAENSRGFCVFCDELTTLLKGFGRYTKDAKGGTAKVFSIRYSTARESKANAWRKAASRPTLASASWARSSPAC